MPTLDSGRCSTPFEPRRLRDTALANTPAPELPDRIADALDAHPDDVLVFETDPTQPDVAHVHLVRQGFAGALTGTYGATEDLKAYLRKEHDAWGE